MFLRIGTGLDSRKFNSGVDSMEKRTQRFSKVAMGLGAKIAGAFSVTAVAGMTRAAIRLGSEISDLATQAGLTTEEFQTLELASIKAGVSSDKIRTVMAKLSVVMGQAKRGMKTYVDMFNAAGISMEQLNRMSPAQVFEELSRTVTKATRGSEEFGAVIELLGTRSGAQLIEVMNQIANEGFQNMIDKAKEAGDVIRDDVIKELDNLEDELQLLERRMTLFFGKRAVGAMSGFDQWKKEVAEATEAFGGGLGGFMRGGGARHALAMGRESEDTKKLLEYRERMRAVEENNANIRDAADKKALEAAEKLKATQETRVWLLEQEERIQKQFKDQEAEKAAANVPKRAGAKVGPVSDRLAQIGTYLGGSAGTAATTDMEKLTNVQRQILTEMQRNPEATAAALRSVINLGST